MSADESSDRRTRAQRCSVYAADESFTSAFERALTEMARNETVLRTWWHLHLSGETKAGGHIFERRCLFFSTDAGHAMFQARLNSKPRNLLHGFDVICDSEIPGPWSDYATVWRFALRPPSRTFLEKREDVFFF